jgi:hypothetical protein
MLTVAIEKGVYRFFGTYMEQSMLTVMYMHIYNFILHSLLYVYMYSLRLWRGESIDFLL